MNSHFIRKHVVVQQRISIIGLYFHLPEIHTSNRRFRWMGTGSRGARGHGWFRQYRMGLGGRHLQGRYHDRDVTKLSALNDKVFAFNNYVQSTNTAASGGESNNYAYLDVSVGDEKDLNHVKPKRITIELATVALPNTCKNFVELCTSGSYQSTKAFRVEKSVGICFGDNASMDSDGSKGRCHESVRNPLEPYNPHTFDHEPTVLTHAQKGIVSMLSTGFDKNDSRFIITTVDDAPQLDGRLVAFGRVKEGLGDLESIVKSSFTKKGRPTVDIRIVGCGVL